MKKILLLALLVVAIALPAVAQDINIQAKPTERWFSGSVRDTAWNWLKWADPQIRAGSNLGTGKVFYVDSNVSNEGDGSSWANATDTLDEAVNLCTAGQGDVIYLAQGHTETLGIATGADAVDIDVDDVTIIQAGSNTISNGFDYSTGTTGSITGAFAIGADDVTLINLRFHANVLDCNEAIDIEAGSAGVSIIGCLFDVELEGTDEFLECIDSPGAASDRLSIIGCQFRMGGGACNAAIQTLDSDYMEVRGCTSVGDYAVANIYGLTTASNHIVIKDNILVNATIGGNAGLNAQPGIELVATTSGVIADNYIVCNVATKAAAVVAADCFLFENYYNEDESSAGTGGIIGTASADD